MVQLRLSESERETGNNYENKGQRHTFGDKTVSGNKPVIFPEH